MPLSLGDIRIVPLIIEKAHPDFWWGELSEWLHAFLATVGRVFGKLYFHLQQKTVDLGIKLTHYIA